MLIAEILANRGEQPLAPIPGMPGRQPPARIAGVNRPQVPDLPAQHVRHSHPVAPPGPDRRPDCAGTTTTQPTPFADTPTC